MGNNYSVDIWNAYCVQVLLALDRIEHDDELSYEVSPLFLFAISFLFCVKPSTEIYHGKIIGSNYWCWKLICSLVALACMISIEI
jgi:hypothetical protein